MLKASYILTWRDGEGTQRRDNLFAVLAWLARFPAIEPIVVEQDDAPRLQGELPHPDVSWVFAYNPGPFNKSWGFNVGFRLSRQPWLAFGDADIIVGDALTAALEHLAQGHQIVKPYRRLLDLDARESQRVRAGDFDWQPDAERAAAHGRDAICERIVFAGGVFLITRAVFAALGGWDERFRGWGGEDDAMSYRIERARLATVELDRRVALHLHHERLRATTLEHPHYASNRALLAEYPSLEDAQLVRFSEIQLQVFGNREKYRPQ